MEKSRWLLIGGVIIVIIVMAAVFATGTGGSGTLLYAFMKFS
jgi:hypothetical protein